MEAPTPSPADRVAAWLLSGPLTLSLLALCGFQLAAWVPHYLTWPWFADHDVFATLALGWEHGRVPYRDLACNNFPGTIYLFWLLGKLFGWGRTVPFYVVDASFVLILGATLVLWSRQRFGRSLPGVVGYAAFLTYYLGLPFDRVGQRDWQGPFFMVIGLLLADAFPGRRSRNLSALTTAIAFSIRPQVVLFLPALVVALVRGVRDDRGSGEGPSVSTTIWAIVRWGLVLTALVVAAFSPLFLAGAWPDFLRGIGLTFYGGHYNQANFGSVVNQSMLQLLHLKFDIVPFALVMLSFTSEARVRDSVRIWLLAYAGAWVYKPLSPVPFPYLEHPLTLIWAINLAVLVVLLLTPGQGRAALRLVAVLMTVMLGVEARPVMCSVAYARQGIEALRRSDDPERAPLGVHIEIPLDPKALAFPWEDYRHTLAYLRTRIGAGTEVANLLHVVPALNGPTGHVTPLPAESLAWLSVHPESHGDFAKGLERAVADSVVVWTPEMGDFTDIYSHYADVQKLEPLIRRLYEPSARFGDIEVWRRKTQPR